MEHALTSVICEKGRERERERERTAATFFLAPFKILNFPNKESFVSWSKIWGLVWDDKCDFWR